MFRHGQAPGGAASLAAERPPRFGIVTKVVLALLLAFASSLAALLVVGSGFDQIGYRLAAVSDFYLPTLARTAELVRESQRLAALGPDILLARTEPTREALRQNLEKSVAEKNRLMAALDSLGAAPEGLESMESNFNALAGKLRALMDQAGQQMALEQQIMDRVGRLHSLSLKIGRLEAEPSGRAARCATRWESLARQAIIDLLAAQGAHGEGPLRRQQEGFATALADMERALACLSGRTLAARLAINGEIRSLGGPDGMFALKRQHVERHQAMEGDLARGRYLSEALMDAVDRVFANVEKETQRHNQQVENIAHDRMAWLAFVTTLLLATALGTYLYLNRVLLRPIRQLRTAIADSLAARPVRFPVPGRDEVGGIVRAVGGYIDTLGKREEQLRRANVAKDLFFAQMSHELRTPLNGVLGYADLLSQEPGLSPTARSHCRMIGWQGAQLLRLIEDLLDNAAIEAGRMQLSPQDTDLAALLAELEASIIHEAFVKGLDFRVDHGPRLPRFIRADGRRLRQVLFNLLVNAVKYTPTGQIQLYATARLDGGGKAKLIFLVADTGPGIPKEDQARLFKPFEKLDTTQPGNGLGLSICNELVTLMGGALALDSAPGQGCRFVFDIPVQTMAEASVLPLASPPSREIETVLELAQLGRWDQVLDWCSDLADGSPEFAAYAHTVRDWIQSGDTCGLRVWLERQSQQSIKIPAG